MRGGSPIRCQSGAGAVYRSVGWGPGGEGVGEEEVGEGGAEGAGAKEPNEGGRGRGCSFQEAQVGEEGGAAEGCAEQGRRQEHTQQGRVLLAGRTF